MYPKLEDFGDSRKNKVSGNHQNSPHEGVRFETIAWTCIYANAEECRFAVFPILHFFSKKLTFFVLGTATYCKQPRESFFLVEKSILKRFFKGDISREVIELLLLGRYRKTNFRDLSELQKQQMAGLHFPMCYFTEPARDISTDGDLITFS